MINRTEREEREYLEVVKEKLLLAVRRVDENVRQHAEELRQKTQYMHEHQSGMDEADVVAAGQSINRMVFTGESASALKKRLMKLGASPYFGRIDFVPKDASESTAYYIGIHTFLDESSRSNIIYDWRAPVSSMFYDFELGEASYTTPGGTVHGNIELKRQYRIRDGQMEYMIENSLNIQDEVLQQELSKSSDDKMKNIVATIQRDQNAVIRNESSRILIIQGVAGSGKTSIALHRIAFLLYRFRDSIRAKDILIISPNKVFANYISNVLPELGEEHIPEVGMEELAGELLEYKFKFQSFFEQVSALVQTHDDQFIERIKFKSSFEFLSKLNQYLIHIENNYFTFTELRIAGTVVPFPFILERFRAYHRMPLLKRFPEVIRDIQQFIRTTTNRKLSGREKSRLWEEVPRMFKINTVLDLYKDFYAWVKRPDLFKIEHGNVLEYADVFPLIYFKIRLEGIDIHSHIKHLLIDEMQDYTAVQYAVITRLFHCKKTILGDVSQTVNPYSSSSADDINRVFPHADTVKLLRSYRSTLEITEFAQAIQRNPDQIAMERHGEQPQVLGFTSSSDEIVEIKKMVTTFQSTENQSLGILCKTEQQAERLYGELKGTGIHLITSESTSFDNGVIITTVHLSKGLEFDEVIVPFASARNYRTNVERSMLYIACTRAMHRLSLTYVNEKSPFLDNKLELSPYQAR
jgi:DNA helicase-2/ATP-dependent DNA helicase PcrA